ncbi:PAAR domain-containing protein [Serratia oryzae]|uniref:PAAR domain-containing protein n=1 Tax=Serratia oryzae TaxID=2034155 RepID=UPI000BB36E2F|nr:PAAR domain-containing protein [Serratia oryzae]
MAVVPVRGGEIRAVTYEFRWAAGYAVARVGDEVIYPDGSTARIISGAGFAHMIEGLPVALVGSELDNGDEIISTPQGSQMHCYRETDQLPEGFMVRMWGMK